MGRASQNHVASSQMRRPLAFLIALFFAFGPLQAVFGASEDARLPACCRRHGAHHCEINAEMLSALQQATGSAPAFKAPSTCSQFPSVVLGSLKTAHAIVASSVRAPVDALKEHVHTALKLVAMAAPIRLQACRAPPVSL